MNAMSRGLSAGALVALLGSSLVQLPALVAAQVDKPAQDQPVAITINPQVFDAYVGEYQPADDPDAPLSFLREGERYYVQTADQSRLEMFPASETHFFLKAAPVSVDFLRDAGGALTSVILRDPSGTAYPLRRISGTPAPVTTIAFTRTEMMIPMRDGTRLFTVVFTPQSQTGPLPIIITRTPYGIEKIDAGDFGKAQKDLAADGYVFVFQDIRGRFRSEGRFVMVRPPRDRSDAKSVDESTDTYDTIDWLVRNVPQNNGRAGIMGVSYDGWLATMALIEPHPALKAVSPQAPVADFWMGDDFFHNGAFRQSYGYEYVKSMESSNVNEVVSLGGADAYDWYAGQKTLGSLTALLGGTLPTWNAFVTHPNRDWFWQQRAVPNYLRQASVPTLVVGGWWDQEDLYGPLATYRALEEHDRNHLVFLVEGPWNHGGWRRQGRGLAGVDFGRSNGNYFRREIEAPWFAYYLKSKGTLKQAEAMIFQSGTNRWMTYDAWPPRRSAQPRKLYLQTNHGLSFDKVVGSADAFDSYVSDPADPVPYRKRPVEATYEPKGSLWYTWLAQDQQFLGNRRDVLSWQTEPLTESVTVTGDIVAHLFAATSGSDSDWVVKLVDVYPSGDPKMAGYQLMVASEVFRGRFRRSFEKPEAIAPGQVNEYTIDLHGNDHAFLKEHRIMVQVQSSWFPLYDRNPQKFVDNIFLAKEGDFQPATQRIYRSARFPSHLSVSVAANR
jgi:uncharacterized protein